MKAKRVFAMIGALLLLILYVSTLVFALLKNPVWNDFLKASVAATIILPVLMYGYVLMYRLLKQRSDDDSSYKE